MPTNTTLTEVGQQVKSYVDKLIGQEGLKTYVSVNIEPKTYAYLGLTIVASVLIGGLALELIKKSFNN